MRLVCPNCSAQYEIDGSMIPDEGRDVQCSNCGHTWFELPPPAAELSDLSLDDFDGDVSQGDDLDAENVSEAAADGDLSDAVDFDSDSKADDLTESELGFSSLNDLSDDDMSELFDDKIDGAASDGDTDSADPDDDEDDALSPSGAVAAAAAAAVSEEVSERVTTEPTTLKPRRPADAAALDILREEAERELSQRRAPASDTIETQTDLGLEELRRRDAPSRALRARMAHLGEEDSETSIAAESAPAREPSEAEIYDKPRRDLLPDIDEINSTLKPARKRQGNAGRGGFLTGFLLMMVLTIALIVAYVQAPALASAFPDYESTLINYVDRANSVRDFIGGLING